MIASVRHLLGKVRLPWRDPPLARVAINLAPRRGPHGGGNQFVLQLERHLRFQGFDVVFGLDTDEPIDCLIVIDGRRELTTFGVAEIEAYRRRHPRAVCLQRVNECDQRKGTQFMDELLATTNRAADHTVFVSAWLRDYHAARWFDAKKPHDVIRSGADPRVFHPLGRRPRAAGEPFRIATHHWSDNPMKGFSAYEELDRRIADGALPGTELWVIGRWPKDIQWRAARLFPPETGAPLAALLRQCHAYVTASLWEPAGMHFIEAAQCGLPPAYHADGGGTPEYVAAFGVPFREDVVEAVRVLRERYADLRVQVLRSGLSGDFMCAEYRELIQRLISLRAVAE